MFVPNFKILGQVVPEKSLTKIFIFITWSERIGKKNGQIKGLIKNMWLILCYTIQLIIPDVYTKFQNPRSSSCCEIFDEKKLTHKREKQKLYTPYILRTPEV